MYHYLRISRKSKRCQSCWVCLKLIAIIVYSVNFSLNSIFIHKILENKLDVYKYVSSFIPFSRSKTLYYKQLPFNKKYHKIKHYRYIRLRNNSNKSICFFQSIFTVYIYIQFQCSNQFNLCHKNVPFQPDFRNQITFHSRLNIKIG